jgi:hypothetical protein
MAAPRNLWVRDRERRLAAVFGIEVGFHTELSNHLHVILGTRPDIVEMWPDEEVVRRWLNAPFSPTPGAASFRFATSCAT